MARLENCITQLFCFFREVTTWTLIAVHFALRRGDLRDSLLSGGGRVTDKVWSPILPRPGLDPRGASAGSTVQCRIPNKSQRPRDIDG